MPDTDPQSPLALARIESINMLLENIPKKGGTVTRATLHDLISEAFNGGVAASAGQLVVLQAAVQPILVEALNKHHDLLTDDSWSETYTIEVSLTIAELRTLSVLTDPTLP